VCRSAGSPAGICLATAVATGLITALMAGLITALITGLITGPPAQAAATSSTSTSVVCPAVAAEVTPEQTAAVFALAARKLSAAAAGGPGRYPFGALRGNPDYQRTGPTGWTSGFFPGELWLMYQHSGSPGWLERARAWTQGLLPVAKFRGSHDLGFMVGIPTSLGYQLDPRPANRSRYAKAESRAARTLAKRWNGRVQAIKSADYGDRWGVIVDSAMNAPMLIEVGDRIGGPAGSRLRNIGIGHLRTLARDFVRPDGSTFHRLAYNPRSGRLIGPIPGQGLNPRTSTWARGQAWAVAGFAQAYAQTGDPQFLDAGRRTATYWMDQVPAGCVPAWDLALDNPGAPRDSSAVAIVAFGLLLLAQAMVDNQAADGASVEELRTYALTALGTLASPNWTTTYSPNPGILRRQTLSVPADPREGTYVWGDYYLLAALRASAGLDRSDASDQVGGEPAVVLGLQDRIPPV